MTTPPAERFETVIIGAGQAGLATGYHLAARGRSFVIVDGYDRIGDPWRRRWDSLRVFTPAGYDGLPGLPFPGPARSFPTKDEIAGFLETYARRFDLPVRTGVTVDRVFREDGRFVVCAGDRRFEADNVVVATGAFHTPRIPAFAGELDPAIRQMHSSDYRNPGQLRDGVVLVVGAGNSGAEIAWDVSRRSSRTWLAGRYTGEETPFRLGGVADRLLLPVMWFVFSRLLTVRSRPGRKFRDWGRTHGHPLARVKRRDLRAAGIERVPRVVGVRDGHPVLADGRVLEVSTVVWCTGYQADYGWIELPAFDDDGVPVHERGVVADVPGLYFVGSFFLFTLTSSLIGGVGRDAEYVAAHLAAHRPAGRLSRSAAG